MIRHKIRTVTYEVSDFGTERVLRVLDVHRRDLVPPRDPFYPGGIPANKSARTRRLNRVKAEMLAECDHLESAGVPF